MIRRLGSARREVRPVFWLIAWATALFEAVAQGDALLLAVLLVGLAGYALLVVVAAAVGSLIDAVGGRSSWRP